ncbi:DUF1850 domain-containing protein [Natronolimnohabitans sp. A-GB9]|uniref:DUF1850 domain-containing protein n=1 Tax=Natronolimnohabitans sp. A-GB9 TaxID=3069757 RepID=UPI0027B2E2BF|nr:DUF1850 domain-containing protein [Natronolimnohabitans sp. A-GB9]MDQ2051850.1 DUF1850 domain-containing protein [Natronolimnohabitans sp. A-GB9]
MHRPLHRYVVVIVLVALVATAVAIPVVQGERTLVVADADTGERLLEEPVDDGTDVTLSYTHSVERTPVEDVYVVDGTTLRMERMVFHSHGAGLPTDDRIERTDEGFVYPVNDTYEEVIVAPGSIAGHELVVDGERHDLVAMADGSVVISVTERRLTDRLPVQLQLDSSSSQPIQ